MARSDQDQQADDVIRGVAASVRDAYGDVPWTVARMHAEVLWAFHIEHIGLRCSEVEERVHSAWTALPPKAG